MDEKKAREILGDTIQKDNTLYNLGWYVACDSPEDICLDAHFDIEDLEAIVWWMKNKIK